MVEFESSPRQSAQGSGASSITLFLGLYLLVLAFFILLVSISTVEKVKSEAVMDSLSSTFSSILPPSADVTAFTTKRGDVIAGEEYQNELSTIFTTAIEAAKVDVVQPGRLMRVVLPSDSLFHSGQARIRSAHLPMFDRIVATLGAPPPGMRHDMDFVIGSAYVEGKGLSAEQTLEMRRAGAFAREMLERGAPRHSVSIGIRRGDPGETVIWFYERFEDEVRLRFTEEEAGEAAP